MEPKTQKILKRTIRSFNKFGMNLLKIFTLFLLIFMSASVSAQIISTDQNDYNYDDTCNGTPFERDGDITGNILPPAVVGVDYCFQIPLDGYSWASDINTGDTQFTVVSAGGCSVSPGFDVLTGHITWSGSDICIPSGVSYLELELEVYENGGSDELITFWLPVLRAKPIKIVYVLDRSGSMGWTVDGGADIRWNILKQSVNLFSSTMEEYLLNDDEIGLSYFASDVIQPGLPMSDGFITLTSGTLISNTLMNLLDVQSPVGSTAMGAGLLDARKKLQWNIPIDETKIVFLFTDGEQNEYPEVLDDGITLENDSLLNKDCNPEDTIKYYTIGMAQSSSPNVTILTKIADENEGEGFASNTFDSFNLTTFFNDHLAEILKTGSPQIVSNKIGILDNGEYVTDFTINGNCSNVLFQLSHNNGDNMTLKIEKDGVDLTNIFKKKTSPYFKILSVDLPFNNTDNYIYSQGKWTVTISGSSEEKFNLTCITDDHFLKYDCETDKSIYKTGENINFSVNLSHAGNPIAGETDTVKVIIFKPGEDLGHLLAVYATPDSNQDSTNIDNSDHYQKFIDLLNNDTTFYNSLLANEKIVILEHQGNGIYTGSYNETELSGIYQLHFLLKGEIPEKGLFIREKLKTVVFEFSELDSDETTVDVDITQGKPGYTAVITVKPKNKFGYYLGPGWLSKIKINYKKKAEGKFLLLRTKANTKDNTSSSEPVIESMVDNLDGSYTFTIINLPPDVDSDDFQIAVFDEVLEQTCYPVTIWYYIILALIVLILIYVFVKKYNKYYKNLLILILIVWIVYIILRYLGIICYEFL